MKLDIYCRTFDEEYNLSTFELEKDCCGYCEEHKAGKVTKEDFDDCAHTEKSTEREEKECDKKPANADSLFHTFCFDLEEALTVPKCKIGELYYKRNLSCFNFLAFSIGNSDIHNYFWSETDGKRGTRA